MDPVSLLFTAYLDSIQNTVHARFTDLYATEIKAVMIEYQGVEVPYQFQLWRVRNKSVCQPYKSQITQFSKCTLAAKALFKDLCAQLNDKPSKHWRHSKMKNRYCNAAVFFEATVAPIGVAGERSEEESARAECNLAIAAALGSRDAVVITEKERVCGGWVGLECLLATQSGR
jgi:hypothetical protein